MESRTLNSARWISRLTWRAAFALAIVGVQAGFVLRARFSTDRFLSWAPHDRQIEYRVECEVGGVRLSQEKIARRYGLTPGGWLSHAIEDLQWTIATRETRLPPTKRATVILAYRINGKTQERWEYP